jgi:hypothetical protein
MSNAEYVHIGCGLCAPLTWRNFDASPTLRLQRLPLAGQLFHGGRFPEFAPNVEYGDIIRGLPVRPDSCRAVYVSHVFNCFSLSEFRIAVRRIHRYLRTDGILRLVLPDMEAIARRYVESTEPDAVHTFLHRCGLGRKERPRRINEMLREWLGSRPLWCWDFKGLHLELNQAGFRGVRRAAFNDSQEPLFKDVENPGQWGGHLGIECIK